LLERGGVIDIERHVAQPREKPVFYLGLEKSFGKMVAERLFRQSAKSRIIEVAPRRPDDPQPVRKQPV
jgi:hypothetical protein